MKLIFQDSRHELNINVNVEFELCPVGQIITKWKNVTVTMGDLSIRNS